MAYSISSDLLFTYGVVDRIHKMLSSYVHPEMEAQPIDLNSVKYEYDDTEMRRISSDLCAALAANTYKSPRNLPEGVYRSNLQRIRTIAYDVEDMLDVAVAKHLMLNVNFPVYSPLQPDQHLLDGMLSELQEIFHVLGFKEDASIAAKSESESADSRSNHKWFYSREDTIVGRESEKQQIIDWIFSSSNQGHPSVISVSGVGGIGKTTLARLVYNDVQVSSRFALLSWAFTFCLDIKSKLVEIVRACCTHQSWHHLERMDTETLKDRLRSILSGQKYLLVLDDIGLQQLAWWEELREVLQVGSTGSIVIVTTQWESVAREIRSTKRFELQYLPEDDCWSLFTSCAGFTEEAQQEYPLLKGIGRSLVKKWYGCPLAIKTLGSMLADNRDERLWKQADESNIWTTFTPAYDALGISFRNMFCELARCFVASAILPENKLMSRDQLVYFWMAQGLIQSRNANEDPRDIGNRYCNQLLFRAFLQLHQTDGREIRQLYHAARHLAVDVMQQEVVSVPGTLFVEQGRHLLWDGDSISVENGFNPYSSTMSKVRTFLVKKEVGHVSKICLEELISKLSLVRVLFLDGAEFEELPETIGNLRLLRYLSLAGNHTLKGLPDSICNLLDLQTLDLSGCVMLHTLPKYMNNLTRLKHFFLSMKVIPTAVWTSLHHLKICNCPNHISLPHMSRSFTALQVLHIHDCYFISFHSRSIEPLRYLKELSILNCIHLRFTQRGILYGPMGLQFLQFQGLPRLREFPEGLMCAANSLRHLIVSNCEKLTALPECLQKCINLSEMVIDNCPNMGTLPKAIKKIQTLQVLKILNCPKLVARCQSGIGEDWHLISHIPRIQLQHQVIQNRATSTLKEHLGFSASTAATNNAAGKTCDCLARGGGRRCSHEHCNKAVIRNSGLCRRHDSGIMRSKKENCTAPSALDLSGLYLIPAGALANAKNLDRQDVVQEIECLGASTISLEDRDLLQQANVMEKMKDYCSILFLLPENYEIEKDTLIQLWMAAREYLKDESMELQEAEECFSFVLNSGYLLHSGSNFMTEKRTYRINIRKINELLDSQKGNGSSYLKWDNEYQQSSRPATESIRHVSLVCSDIDETIFQTLQQFNKLRTLLFLANHGHRVKHIPNQLFLGLDNLQALDLSKTQIKELPSSIGHMTHLRYLDLSWTLIEWLPDTICLLNKLQTLKLRGCSSLCELPGQLKWLTKLQHLDVDVLRQLEIMPRGIGSLVNLQTLSAFLVGTEDGCKIQELKGLNKIAGNLCIAKLEHVEDANEAREATLYKKEQLTKLELRWTASELSGTHNNSYTILEYLQPCTTLEELRILCYEGATFPSWISSPEFNKLVRIVFYRCENLRELPLIEQLPYLSHLGLTKMNSIMKMERREMEKDVAFPKLEKLEINEMQSLKVWDLKKRNEGDFISLTQLIINECPELEVFDVLPHLSSIKHFEIRECPKLQSLSDMKLPDSLEELVVEDCLEIQKKCLEQEGVDWYKIKHVPTKNIQELD